jgi:RHS repeat-associated protein
MITDGANTYLYDAEDRICAVAAPNAFGGTTFTGYIYDAAGTRVSKGTIQVLSCDPITSGFAATNDYILGPGGEQLTEYAMNVTNGVSAMAWLHTNVFAAGHLIGTYDDTEVHFYMDDQVGTRRVQTDYAGNIEQTCSSLPYGDGETCGSTPTEHLFTGKERDAESGNDYFGARYYSSAMGRFMSPDPLPWPHWQNGSKEDEGRFEEFIANPQNLNQYMYVRNNPLTSVDPDGLDVYVVAYTTGNNHGGDEELQRAAQTKKDEITSSKGFDPKKDTVIMGGVKTKEDFQNLLTAAAKVSDQFGQTSSVSLFSHSGDLDGPVFHDASGNATQFTQSDLANLKVNWSSNATASFFGCRTADNFAQNFANAQHVRTFGFNGGVDFSGNPNSVSKWYVLNGQFQRYMVDKGEQGLKEKDPK